MAIKSILFQQNEHDRMQQVVDEVSIATCLDHPNIVQTYAHEVSCLSEASSTSPEPGVFKLLLIQVRSPHINLHHTRRTKLLFLAVLPRVVRSMLYEMLMYLTSCLLQSAGQTAVDFLCRSSAGEGR